MRRGHLLAAGAIHEALLDYLALSLSSIGCALGQQKYPQPIDIVVTSDIGSYHIIGSIDAHGCLTQADSYNPKLRRCETSITKISPNGETVHCTLLERGSIGEQKIACYYIPKRPRP